MTPKKPIKIAVHLRQPIVSFRKNIAKIHAKIGTACEITVTLLNTDNDVFSLFKQKDIAAKTTTELLTNPLVMNTDEELKIQAENANDLHVVCSYLEIT